MTKTLSYSIPFPLSFGNWQDVKSKSDRLSATGSASAYLDLCHYLHWQSQWHIAEYRTRNRAKEMQKGAGVKQAPGVYTGG